MSHPAAALTRPRRSSTRLLAPLPRLLAPLLGLALLLPLLGGPALADDAPPVPSPPAATESDLQKAADQVAQAAAQVEAMQAQVAQTAAVLAEGSVRLEAGQAALARTQAELIVAQTAAKQAQQRSVDAKAKLAVVVSASYRSPVPRSLQMALTAGPDDIVDVIVARHALDRVQGDSQDLLRKATAARVEAEQARTHAAQLTTAAAQQEQALAAEVAQLGAVARQSEQTLTAAAAALAAAQTDQSSLLAIAEARARAAESERLARMAAGSYIVATCAGPATGPQANGLLDAASLCPLDDAPGAALRPDAATAFNALNAAYKAERGTPMCVTDSYRSYAAQVDVFARKPQLAAVPGRSNHGWGLAVDFGCGVQRFGSPEHEWMRANAGRFGWFHPAWAQAGGSRPEAWHWEFAGGK